MTRLRLPIGIQTFREIREGGFYYVDKTGFAKRLVEEGKHYFLSRPRRFGKSLFLDTLKELFEGNEPLFRGLEIHADRKWSERHPVVRLSWGGADFRSTPLADIAEARLEEIEGDLDVTGRPGPAPVRLRRLIRALHRKTGRRAVVLVDEYDKPILDVLGEPETARRHRDYLRGLYGVVKDADAHVRFSFFTGVSRFTRVSLFSELNNLTDITLAPSYSSLCGYTEADLDRVFAPELPGFDRERIREWYNGYNWRGPERVYNPFDILLLFRQREFDVHWFETATPSFLIETLRRDGLFTPSLDGMFGTRELLSSFDIDEIAPEALLFQTGYLTIAGEEDWGGRPMYRLGYPNREVRQSLNEHLLGALTPSEARRAAPSGRLAGLFEARDFDGIEALFRAFFASIPFEWHTKNALGRYEGYYASVFYSYCAASGLEAVAEDSSSRGRLDLAVRLRDAAYLIEFKVVDDEPTGSALAQLKAREYAEKHRERSEEIYLIGVEFSRASRNLAAFEVERA